MRCDAWLTPDMERLWAQSAATVHSVFASAANLSFDPQGARRLFTLTCGFDLRLPDSAHVPAYVISGLEPGMPVPVRATPSGYAFVLRGEPLPLGIRRDWSGLLPENGTPFPAIRPDRVRAAESALAGARNGLDLLPEPIRTHARQALRTKDAPAYLGLGAGLTPSFDDACIGVMACCAAFGCPTPFRLTDLNATTEISARYLNLAREGYFGEPLCMLMDAFGGKRELRPALDALLGVGATSGADMLLGAVWMASSILT